MLQHPWWRETLLGALETLADRAYQQQVWIEKHYPPNVQYDDFDRVVHVLFDDTALADAPEKTIGYILEDETEMHAVTVVIKLIDAMLKTHGTDLTDEQYLQTPEWAQVVAVAQTALSVLNKKPVASQ
jgi:putative heme iron utilization protein